MFDKTLREASFILELLAKPEKSDFGTLKFEDSLIQSKTFDRLPRGNSAHYLVNELCHDHHRDTFGMWMDP